MKLGFYWARKPHNVSTFTQTQAPASCQSCLIMHGHPDWDGYMTEDPKPKRYFYLNMRKIWQRCKFATFYELIYVHIRDERSPNRQPNIKQMRGKSVIKMNEDLSEMTKESLEYLKLHSLQWGRVTFWVNQSHPSPSRPHHHNRLAFLWLFTQDSLHVSH